MCNSAAPKPKSSSFASKKTSDALAEVARNIEFFKISAEQCKSSIPSFDEWFETLASNELSAQKSDLSARVFEHHQLMATIARLVIKTADKLIEHHAIGHLELRSVLDIASQTITILSDALPQAIAIELKIRKTRNSAMAKAGANALHDKPQGSRSKVKEIQRIWASGKYKTRDVCAEQECAALGMGFGTARRALRNMPNPG